MTRELRLAALDGSEVVIPLGGRFSDTVKVNMNGDLAWAVVFKDANGKVLCSSPIGLLAAGAGGGQNAGGSASSLSGTVAGVAPATVPAAPPPRLVAGFTNNGRLVIVLQNSPYTGQYAKLVEADNYDITAADVAGVSGVELHGNNVANKVTGSPKNDLIWLYGGNDEAEGGAGDDILVGGEGEDTLTDRAPIGGNDTDTLYGGPGRDNLNVADSDDDDFAYLGSGGGGNVAANGGDFAINGGGRRSLTLTSCDDPTPQGGLGGGERRIDG